MREMMREEEKTRQGARAAAPDVTIFGSVSVCVYHANRCPDCPQVANTNLFARPSIRKPLRFDTPTADQLCHDERKMFTKIFPSRQWIGNPFVAPPSSPLRPARSASVQSVT